MHRYFFNSRHFCEDVGILEQAAGSISIRGCATFTRRRLIDDYSKFPLKLFLDLFLIELPLVFCR